jgi:hypothetical protein
VSGATVAVVGLGDLGSRVLHGLARSHVVGRLVGCSRRDDAGRAEVGQARLVAAFAGGPRFVGHAHVDVADVAATAAALRRLDPACVVMAASRHTWWRGGVEGVPYGAWLPLVLAPVRDLVRARDEAGLAAPVVCLPFPDNVGPALRPLGLAPELGAGNVSEVAAKLALAAGEGARVRLVMHHAAQRHAFGRFAALGPGEPAGEPPWAAEVSVGGAALEEARVRELFHAPWPLPGGPRTHELTAAATVSAVEALLGDEPCPAHVPAPGGRPGGYPVRLGAGRVALDLPAGMSEAAAVELNARAARWDGLERVEGDGTIVFTADVAGAAQRLLGLRLERVAPDELDAAAAELEAARDRRARPR